MDFLEFRAKTNTKKCNPPRTVAILFGTYYLELWDTFFSSLGVNSQLVECRREVLQ